MAYRGQDLDLRVGRPAAFRTTGDVASDLPYRLGGREGPIAVDDTLLATCNHAYEAAQFYGSREVRLEHLVYALTRVAGAAQILDDLGIRPERLRREAAMAITNETPAAAADAHNEPVTSEEMETALRRTSERAADRGTLAGVVDLVRTIVGLGREAPSYALLTRATSDPQRLERFREEATRREPSLTEVLRAAHGAPEANPALAGRLEAIEAAVKGLSADVGAERQTVQALLRQIQDAVATVRAELPSPVQPLADRTDEIKGTLEARLQDVSELILSLDERLHGLAQAPAAALPLEDMGARFDRLEQRFADQSTELSRTVTPALSERLSQLIGERISEIDGITSRLQSQPGVPQEALAELATKFGQLEAAIRQHLQHAEELSKTHERDLSEIYEALVKLGANQQTLANNLNTWRLDTSGDVSIVSNRLEALETTVLESLGRISAELQMLHPPALREEPQALESGGGFKRWLYGTNRVLSSRWGETRPGALRQALSRVRLVKRT